MATISWGQTSGGLFQNSALWAGGVVPGPTSDAVFGAGNGAAYTVTVESGLMGVAAGATQSVGSVNIASNATVSVIGFTDTNAQTGAASGFNIINGGVNAGMIVVQNSARQSTVNGVTKEFGGGGLLVAGGTLNNSGMISLAAQAPMAGLATSSQQAKLVANGTLTLNGGGHLSLSDQANNLIVGGAAPSALVNVNNTISGAGSIGGNGLAIANQSGGVIDANAMHNLIISTTAAIDNEGLLEATNKGTLVVSNGTRTITNGGQINAAGGGKVMIDSPLLNNGVLMAQTGGALTVSGQVSGGGHVNISGGDADFMSRFTQNVNFNVSTGGHLFLGDSADYTGTISGFSHTGISSVDLEDIAFGPTTTETMIQIAGGVELTVTNGTVTAHLDFAGTFGPGSFSLSRADNGSTLVMDPRVAPLPHTGATASRLSSAMASMSPSSVGATSMGTHPIIASRTLALASAHA